MTTREIVAKLWNLCNVLRDDGITYHQYVTELTYILFLKMAGETGTESAIPEACRWDVLAAKSGIELKHVYKRVLAELSENGTGRVREIYQGAVSNIDEPKNLEKIISSINALDWYSAREEGLGNLYEGLLEKNANEKKSGAGQYFTPRVLIDVMVRLMKPRVGELCNDPACGTFGFMIAADRYLKDQTDEYFDLDEEQAIFQKQKAFTGCELVHDTHRLALMNAMLHGIEGEILLADTLSTAGKALKGYDLVLTNPPFGTKKGGERATRDDFAFATSNKQLNFLQHIYRSLKRGGRAAVVLPDNVLFADGDGGRIRADFMDKCDLHTVLRLPTGIFYAQGVKTNVLFFATRAIPKRCCFTTCAPTCFPSAKPPRSGKSTSQTLRPPMRPKTAARCGTNAGVSSPVKRYRPGRTALTSASSGMTPCWNMTTCPTPSTAARNASPSWKRLWTS